MMQVTKVWWDGERLMAEPIDPTTIYQEPAQQPQRWAVFCQGCRKEWSVSYPHPGKDICVDCDDKLAPPWSAGVPPLYPEPEPGVSIKAEYEQPAQRTWVGLTDEERDEICLGDESIARAIEAKLKEKNA